MSPSQINPKHLPSSDVNFVSLRRRQFVTPLNGDGGVIKDVLVGDNSGLWVVSGVDQSLYKQMCGGCIRQREG